MTSVDLYVDPVCPFGWAAAQWLLEAGRTTGTEITLRQMSLATLNEGRDIDPEHRPRIDRSRRMGRLFAIVADRYGVDGFTRLYQEFGRRSHVHDERLTDKDLSTMLAALGMDRSLAEAVGDSDLDQSVSRAHNASQKALGGAGGCPIIEIDGRGFFGPVLTEIPAPRAGTELLAALITLAETPGFATIQRPYSGPPATSGRITD